MFVKGLVKPKKYDWKDSNLALFGSDTEKSVKSAYIPCIGIILVFKSRIECIQMNVHVFNILSRQKPKILITIYLLLFLVVYFSLYCSAADKVFSREMSDFE